MRIGIDFDNTIAGYDHVFRREAQRLGWLAPAFIGGKRRVRAALDGERWMRLQGQVYGRLMPAAELLPGAESFFSRARKAGHELFIVSHKTRFGHFDGARVDLRRAALEWMSMQISEPTRIRSSPYAHILFTKKKINQARTEHSASQTTTKSPRP